MKDLPAFITGGLNIYFDNKEIIVDNRCYSQYPTSNKYSFKTHKEVKEFLQPFGSRVIEFYTELVINKRKFQKSST